MSKKKIAVGIVVFFVLGLCSSITSARPSKRLDPTTKQCRIFTADAEWWGAGNKIFQQKCKSCHFQGNNEGAPFLHSESKSPRAWNRIFFKKYPKCAQDGSWDITLDEQLVLNDFLYRNGADTYDAYNADDCG
jgi:hypothetical protein